VPELIEVETYRAAATAVVGRRIREVHLLDPGWSRTPGGADALRAALVGSVVQQVRRHGKLLLVDVGDVTAALRFGMTGRLVVDGSPAIDALEYGPVALRPEWDRLVVDFVGGGSLAVNDPRRLGSVEVDPELDRLGPDALEVSAAQLRDALRSLSPLKTTLMNQRRIAGLGNLLVDDLLWRAGLSPHRPASEVTTEETRRLRRTIGVTVAELSARGGSHTGDLQPFRRQGGRCPRCGASLRRDRIGGRMTVWCPGEQR
jgi:formamidopyrimidine-DNA glycosylase